MTGQSGWIAPSLVVNPPICAIVNQGNIDWRASTLANLCVGFHTSIPSYASFTLEEQRDVHIDKPTFAVFGGRWSILQEVLLVDGLYEIIVTIHNAVGGITLLLTLAAAGVLLATARTTTSLSSTIVRADTISASIQATLGILLVILGLVIFDAATMGRLWLHYLLGIITVGVISVIAARARRAPDAEARRYGLILLGVLALVLVTFLVGQYQYNPLA